MRTVQELQAGLVAWFPYEAGSRDNRNIKEACYNLYKSQSSGADPNQTARMAVAKIFEPLFRSGIIEFKGNGRYAISPTSALQGAEHILLINSWRTLPESIEILFEFATGIRLMRKTETLIKWLKELRIQVSPFSFHSEINILKPLPEIVDGWPNDEDAGQVFEQLLTDNGWKFTTSSDTIGIYRKSKQVYSQRIIKVKEGIWKKVETTHKNPEINRLAMLWAIPPKSGKLVYTSKSQELKISTSAFPRLLERLIMINSILTEPEATDINLRKYKINEAALNNINKLMGNKIDIQ